MNKKLHILFLCSWLPSRVKPTSGDFVQRHAEAVARKHKVTAIHVITDEFIHSKIEYDSSIVNNVQIVIGYIPKTWNPLLKFYYFVKAYSKILSKVDFFDLVHLNVTYPKGIVALYLKWFKKKPFIITEHWTGYEYPLNKHIGRLRKKITQIIIKNADYICPVSNYQKKDMIKFGLKGNYITIPNVIDTTLFYPNNHQNRQYIITHISSFNDDQKNISGILRTIKKLSLIRNNFIFNILGNNDFNNVQNLIKKLNIPPQNISLEGFIEHKKIPKNFRESSLYISFSNHESFGIVMAEAIACGVPVISTNTGILREFETEDYYSIIPIKDEDALLNKIKYYMDSNKKYDTDIMHSYIKNNFSVDIVCNRYSNLYYKSLTNIS